MSSQTSAGSERSDDHPIVRAADHDIRTPFNALLGLADLLIDFGADLSAEQIRHHVGRMREASLLAFRISTRLADFARLQTGAQPDAICPVDPLLMLAVEAHRPRALQNGVQFDGPADTGAHVRGDGRFLALAVEALMENAVKHAPGGGRIAVSARGDDDAVVIIVADDGPGLSATAGENPFTPGVKHGEGATDGAGLSLALARAIAESCGGTLVHGPGLDGAGVSFTLTLRRAAD